uniref:Uncharacterized protein n=1 Tax=Anguilla anguilla TaxID=7936 RepID=A0A0E9ULE9_ANGAN
MRCSYSAAVKSYLQKH